MKKQTKCVLACLMISIIAAVTGIFYFGHGILNAPEPVKNLRYEVFEFEGDPIIYLSWDKRENVDGYEIFISLQNAKEYDNLIKVKTNTAVLCGLRPSTPYNFSVRSYKGPVYSTFSNIVELTTS